MSSFRLLLVFAAATIGCVSEARAAAPSGRYTIGNGTVYDTKTKLTWQQTVPPTTYSYSDAVTYCSDLGVTLSGAWRVPTVKELLTIVDFSQARAPWIDAAAFPGTPLHFFWTSTTRRDLYGGTWVVDFSQGNINSPGMSTDNNVRCVH